MKLRAGCGFMVPVSLDGVDVTGADLADLAGDAGRIERPSGTWELESRPDGTVGVRPTREGAES